MIERFNFYDLYGYAFPGLAAILVVWLPFGLVVKSWPNASSTSAAVVIAAVAAAAYLVGHLMQTIAAVSFPSSRKKGDRILLPSVLQLDPSDSTFSPELKAQIGRRVSSWFDLDIDVKREADDALAKLRQDAFFMCRGVVNQSSSYAEQQEGMYTLMRGLVLASMTGFWYTAGWALSGWRTPNLHSAIVVVFVIGAGATLGFSALRIFEKIPTKISMRLDRFSVIAIAASFLSAGLFLGSGNTPSPEVSYVLWALVAVYGVAFLRFFVAYRIFASGFAKTVWNHFAAEPLARPTK